MRAIQRPGLKSNPYFEAANRGKRGLGLDLTKAEGREYLKQLIQGADVFITNMRDDACPAHSLAGCRGRLWLRAAWRSR